MGKNTAKPRAAQLRPAQPRAAHPSARPASEWSVPAATVVAAMFRVLMQPVLGIRREELRPVARIGQVPHELAHGARRNRIGGRLRALGARQVLDGRDPAAFGPDAEHGEGRPEFRGVGSGHRVTPSSSDAAGT